MAKKLTYVPNRVIDTNGISDGATIGVYQTGTLTKVTLYSDSGLTTAVSNPYTVAAGAAVPALYYDYSGNVRVIITPDDGAAPEDYDPYERPVSDVELSSNSSSRGGSLIGLTDGGTVQDHFDSDGGVIAGTVAFAPNTGNITSYGVFRNTNPASTATRVYVTPPESTLGQTNEDDGVLASFTVFLDDYDKQLAESLTNANWTGPHYRDGGISGMVGSTFSPDATQYSGHFNVNAKIGGNWWPFRPSIGLSVSEAPIVTAFELLPFLSLPGPTYAGGGFYPSDMWRPGKVYSAGDICHSNGRIYEVTTGGTSGQTPPLHDGMGQEAFAPAQADAWDDTIETTRGTFSGTTASITGITSADPAVFTTSSAHGLSVGDQVFISGVLGLPEANNDRIVATVPSPTTFTCENRRGTPFNASTYGPYTSGGEVKKGAWTGTDGGGVVQYQLIEQLYPQSALDKVLYLGLPRTDAGPLIGMGNGVQVNLPTYVTPDAKIVGVRRESNNTGTSGDAGIHVDTNGAMLFGYSQTSGLFARHNSQTDLKFNSVSYSLSEKVKASGDTTVDVSGVNIVKFSDGAATNFTGFTNAQQGQVIHLIFNNGNTTLVHSTGSLRIPGGANITPGSNDAYTVVMRSASTAQIIGSP